MTYIISNFEKTLIWLMDSYPSTMFKLKTTLAKDIFIEITDNKELIENIISDDSDILLNSNAERIVSIYLFLADLQNKMYAIKGKVISLDDADYIYQSMILLNSEMTQFFIEEAQAKKDFSFDNVYSQSSIIISYIRIIFEDMKRREKIQEHYPDKNILNNRYLRIVSEFDWDIIESHLEYLMLINTLMCIQISPFFKEKDKYIAKWFLNCFGEIFTDCRIEEMYLEPNTMFSEEECGPRTTTKMEIFFSQSNGDRYQLRLDFPHDDKNYIHFNLYEPFKTAAYPIEFEEYDRLQEKHGNIIVDLFYLYGNKFWFKSNFLENANKIRALNEEAYYDVVNLFNERTHNYVCDNEITEEEMKSFLVELFSAIWVMGVKHSKYIKPKLVDEKKRLEHITLKKYIREAAYKIDAALIYKLTNEDIPDDLKDELNIIKYNLINELLSYCGDFKIEELIELSDIELFEFAKAYLEAE